MSTWHSASIFWLEFGVTADWQLLETSVRSPILPEARLFARGVWDSSTAGLEIPEGGLQVQLTVEVIS